MFPNDQILLHNAFVVAQANGNLIISSEREGPASRSPISLISLSLFSQYGVYFLPPRPHLNSLGWTKG